MTRTTKVTKATAVLALTLLAACADGTAPSPAPGSPTLIAARGLGEHGGGPPLSIAFASRRDRPLPQIFVMNADGSDQTRLTDLPGLNTQPDWSPNGKLIAFVSTRTGNRDVFVMNADGSGAVDLTDQPADDQGPVWSTNGKQIAFFSNRDGDYEIYVMDAEGAGLRQLTDYPGVDEWPDWSPNSKRIAFDRDGDIYVMNADGSDATRLTSGAAMDAMPSWSPNGKQLAFTRLENGYYAIYVMNADGSGLVNLTPRPPELAGLRVDQWGNQWPSWSRNGKQIYFQSWRLDVTGADTEIFVMNADGSGIMRLTYAPGIDSAPVSR